MTILSYILVAATTATIGYAIGWLLGERRGNDRGRETERASLSEVVAAAATQSHDHARKAFDEATARAMAQLGEQRKSERDLNVAALSTAAAPLQQSLSDIRQWGEEIERRRSEQHGAVATMTERIHEQYAAFQTEAHDLMKALHGDRSARGVWGETQLRNLVEIAGLKEHVDFVTQTATTTGGRPDMVVRLPGGGGVAIDAKTPMDAYLSAVDTEDEAERENLLQQHARSLRQQIKDLAGRNYPEGIDHGVPFVVLFLPVEPLLAEAVRFDAGLLQFAADNRVVLATPFTLLGVLWAVQGSWRHHESSRNVERMRDAGRELEKRLGVFIEHFSTVGDRLRKTTEAYNAAVGSADGRLVPGLRRLRELGGRPEDSTPLEGARVDVLPRRFESAGPVPDDIDADGPPGYYATSRPGNGVPDAPSLLDPIPLSCADSPAPDWLDPAPAEHAEADEPSPPNESGVEETPPAPSPGTALA